LTLPPSYLVQATPATQLANLVTSVAQLENLLNLLAQTVTNDPTTSLAEITVLNPLVQSLIAQVTIAGGLIESFQTQLGTLVAGVSGPSGSSGPAS